jgi:hypothetical protein
MVAIWRATVRASAPVRGLFEKSPCAKTDCLSIAYGEALLYQDIGVLFRRHGLAGESGYHCSGHQHQNHEILELVEEHGEGGSFLLLGQFVRTILCKALRRFPGSKALGRRFSLFKNLLSS